MSNSPRREGEEEVYTRAPRRLGTQTSLENTEKGVTDGFFLASNVHKTIFGRGLCWGLESPLGDVERPS